MSCQMISLDISTKSTGYAVFKDGIYNRSGVISYDNKDAQKRLYIMAQYMLTAIDLMDTSIIVVEQPIFNKNVNTFRELSMMVGVVYGCCVNHNIEYHSLLPTQWRALISSEKKPRKRKELKEWGKQKVKELYGFYVDTDDESDAILIGTAYGNLFKEK